MGMGDLHRFRPLVDLPAPNGAMPLKRLDYLQEILQQLQSEGYGLRYRIVFCHLTLLLCLWLAFEPLVHLGENHIGSHHPLMPVGR